MVRDPVQLADGLLALSDRGAGVPLRELALVGPTESEGVEKGLRAAAFTYVAGALAALSLLVYYALIFFGNRD